METGKAIYKLLKDSADVGAICADRIYPELAQQDVDVPFIVYTVTDTTPSDTKNSTSKLDTARVELYCVSDDYEQSMNLGIAVRGALDRHTGTVSGVEVQSIDFDTSDVQFDPDQRVYVLEQTYDVRVQRTGTAVTVASFPSNTFTVEETDGSPSGAVNTLKVSPGTLSITGNVATIKTGQPKITSVNAKVGVVVINPDDLDDSSTTNKFATQAQLDKVDHLTVTQAVDLDTIESDTATNNAKVSYTDAAVDARIALANTTDLADTPASLGTAGQVLAVNTGATALEFVDQAGDVTSVNTQTGDVVLDADDISDAATTNKFATQAQLDKVDHLTVTQAVNLDTIESDTATNNAKVSYTDAAVDARIALANTTDLADTPASLGTAGQVLAVNSGATALEFVDQSTVDTQYHGRYDTEAETERSGATGDVEFYYTARPDGDGTAESETSDVGETGTINRTLAYSTKFQADPDTSGDWTDYTTQPADNATFATAKAALLAGLNETDATAETRGTLPVSLKMTRTVTAVTNLLLDDYTGAATAYSVRKLDKDYTGNCMRVRRSNDNAETDIGFDSNGDLDTAAIASHCGSAQGYVVTWYDQSGNSNNATQSTTREQPWIYSGTAVFTLNGKPVIKNSTVSLSRNSLTVSSQSFTTNNWVFSVNQVDSAYPFSCVMSGAGGGDFVGIAQNGSSLSAHSNVSSVVQYRDGATWSGTLRSDWYTALVNNQSLLALNFSATWTTFTIGYKNSDAVDLNPMQEFILWTTDQSSNRSGIETNQNNYFSIY